ARREGEKRSRTRPAHGVDAIRSSFVEPKGALQVIRVFVVYEQEPSEERYARHVELCRRVAGATFRHGKVFGAPTGDPRYRYYAEWEWPDLDAFKSAARGEEFMATGKDAMEMGGRFTVMFADVD